MELSYWQSKWRKGHIGFHMKNGHPGLAKYWDSVSFDSNPVALVPLCGKSKDLLFLSDHCEKVIGVEISEIAIQEFLSENNFTSKKKTFADFTIYQTKNIEIWQGDFFKLPSHKISSPGLIYDRAALVALPPKMREVYAEKIIELASPHTKIFLQIFEYPQHEMNGPPFSVSVKEVEKFFGKKFSIQILEKNHQDFKNFKNRGLHSYFIEILSLLLPEEGWI